MEEQLIDKDALMRVWDQGFKINVDENIKPVSTEEKIEIKNYENAEKSTPVETKEDEIAKGDTEQPKGVKEDYELLKKQLSESKSWGHRRI
jgi:hypothetical protein